VNILVKKVITGNSAVAYGAKIARAEVIAAYPITPQTTIVEKIADFVSNGDLDAQYIKVESEHSAMAACIAASNTGARAFTATSAQGLALMHELLIWASGARTPVVVANVNRAMGPPWSIWTDHLDSVAQRDTGWIQFYCESNQEVLDTIIQAFKISEKHDILLPSLLTLDAFFLSHTVEPVDIPDQALVDEYLPKFDPPYKLDVDKPHGFGSLVMPHSFYMEFRYKIAKAMEQAKKYVKEVDSEFEKIFGRSYGGAIDFYHCDDADIIMIGAGTMVSTAREVVDELRSEGEKVGLAKLRTFRPFPVEEIRQLAESAKVLGVIDRSYSFGYGGAFFSEIKGGLYNYDKHPIIKNYVMGIGGRDITPKDLRAVFKNCLSLKDSGLDREIEWYGLKGEDDLNTGVV
jgi:2-oxoisovalerate ferredoxin oxidoreductase alpha subunit